MYGLPWNLTAYGGIQSATHYQAALLGLGISRAVGSLSVDGSDTHSQRQGRRYSKEPRRLRYSNQLTATGTNFSDEMAVCLAGL